VIKSPIAQSWIEKEGRTSEELQTVLELFTADYYKSSIAQSWLSKEGRTLEDLKFVLPLIENKLSVVEYWLTVKRK